MPAASLGMTREWSARMKRTIKWTAAAALTSIAIILINRTIQRGRARLKNALGQAEAVADKTRATLEQTQSALHSARTAI
jgi:hypothetical protein